MKRRAFTTGRRGGGRHIDCLHSRSPGRVCGLTLRDIFEEQNSAG
jgi:hypothetical protein